MSRAGVDAVPFAAGLLRTHVGGRAREARTAADVPLAEGQAEIGNERLAAAVQEDIARLDVAVHQALACGRSAALRRPWPPAPRPRRATAARLQPRREVRAVDELRDDVAGELVAACPRRGPARCADGRGWRPCGPLADRLPHLRPAITSLRMRNLDRHRPCQLVVARQIDQPESAPSQQSLDAIASDPLRKFGQFRFGPLAEEVVRRRIFGELGHAAVKSYSSRSAEMDQPYSSHPRLRTLPIIHRPAASATTAMEIKDSVPGSGTGATMPPGAGAATGSSARGSLLERIPPKAAACRRSSSSRRLASKLAGAPACRC